MIFPLFRSRGATDFESLKNDIILDCEKAEEKLMGGWYPKVINVFADKNNFANIRPDKMDSFYNSVTCLISIQVCSVWTCSES